MNILESLLLALALCVDSLVVSTTCATKTKMSYSRGVVLALIFALFQGGFPLIGALIGTVCQSLIENIDHWIAFSLLLIIGVKMIIDAFKSEEDDHKLDLTSIGVMCTLGVATSIDAFVVGIGFGLNSNLLNILITVLIITIVTFLATMLGVFLGKQHIPIPEKWATIIAGLVLIGLGVKTLLEHLVF